MYPKIRLTGFISKFSLAVVECSIPYESWEVMAISSDLRSEATEEEGIAIASKDEEGIEQCVRAMLTVLTL